MIKPDYTKLHPASGAAPTPTSLPSAPGAPPPAPPPVAPTSGGVFNFDTDDPESALHVNLGLICILIGEIFAFQPREQKIGDISDLEQANTNAIAAFSSMSSLMSYLLGKSKQVEPSDLQNDPQYTAARNTFMEQFMKEFKSYTPEGPNDTSSNGNPKLSDIKFTVTVKEPDGTLKKIQISASDPVFQKYWTSWGNSMGKYGLTNMVKGQDGKMYNEPIITTNGSTYVSGMQEYIAKYLQTKLDSMPAISVHGSSTYSSDDEVKNDLESLLNGPKSPCPPDISSTPSVALQKIWGVYNSIPNTTDDANCTDCKPPIIAPTTSMLSALMESDWNYKDVDANFSFWTNVNIYSDGSGSDSDLTPGQKWVKDNNLQNPLSEWSSEISDAETGVNTDSSLQTQSLQQTSSELNVIQQAIAQIVEQTGELISTIVKGFLQG